MKTHDIYHKIFAIRINILNICKTEIQKLQFISTHYTTIHIPNHNLYNIYFEIICLIKIYRRRLCSKKKTVSIILFTTKKNHLLQHHIIFYSFHNGCRLSVVLNMISMNTLQPFLYIIYIMLIF